MFFTIHYITALRMPQGRIQAIHLLSIHNNKQSPILAPTKIHIFPNSAKKNAISIHQFYHIYQIYHLYHLYPLFHIFQQPTTKIYIYQKKFVSLHFV